MTVLRDRRDKIRRRAEPGIETRAIGALIHAPAVVPAYGDDVDLFQRALSDVADIQLSRLPIERKAERIAHSHRENLVATRQLRRNRDCSAARSTGSGQPGWSTSMRRIFPSNSLMF